MSTTAHILHSRNAIRGVASSLQRLQRVRARLLRVPIELRVVAAHLPLLRPPQAERPLNLRALAHAHAEKQY